MADHNNGEGERLMPDPATREIQAKKATKKIKNTPDEANLKRRCVSTACIACRRRKSKCDGQQPACAACSSVYRTECIYDPNSDHRRKGIYREKISSLKTRNATLQTLIQAIINAAEDDVLTLVRQIRSCENLDDVADQILRQKQGLDGDEDTDENDTDTSPSKSLPTFEKEFSGKMGELRLENGSVRFLGGTSNLIYLEPMEDPDVLACPDVLQQQEEPFTSWTSVTHDTELILHLINMYFTWHYPYFTTMSKNLFYRDFLLGKPQDTSKRTRYCSSLLVNSILALGCHFTNSTKGYADPSDSSTKGDAFFAEAKRLIVENDEFEKPKLTTVQALALMSVREAGCGREAKGWVYSGMSFRMAQDMGLNLDCSGIVNREKLDEKEIDARRVTFWGCFLFDKCWSNYLGRSPQLPISNLTTPKYDVFPDEDGDIWSPYTDNGISQLHSQASRTRTVALQILSLCEISSDLLIFFYHPQYLEHPVGRTQELKKLSELQTRLEFWRRELPKELEPKEGQLPSVLLMHMFFHLLYIHLFRPFLKYNPSTSPLPSHISPRKICAQAAEMVSKLMRLYKRTYGLRQICNIAVYIVHSACTIHLLSLPDKTAKRDIIHGVKHLEEIAEDWLCARRTLSILSVLSRKWKIDVPEEASAVFTRTNAKFGFFSTGDVPSPKQEAIVSTPPSVVNTPLSQKLQPQPSVPMQNQTISQSQTLLQQSLYSYPDAFGILRPLPSPQSIPSPCSTQNQSRDQNQSPVHELWSSSSTHTSSLPYPYAQGPSISPRNSKEVPHSNSAYAEASTHKTNSNTLFGSVEALVQSQDWWLRDQSNLIQGFSNWTGTQAAVSTGPSAGENLGLTTSTNASRSSGVATTNAEMDALEGSIQYYLSSSHQLGQRGGFGDQDWCYG